MNDPFTFNLFLPEMHDRRWLERRKHLYENPEEYKNILCKKVIKIGRKQRPGELIRR